MHMSLYRSVLLLVLFSSTRALLANVSSFSPVFGSPGDQVTILGSGFYPGTLVVRFNGVQDFTAQANAADGTSILARVPAGATNGPISVSVNGGAPASSVQDFTVIGPGPYVTGFTPDVGSAGLKVTISGVHFTSVTNVFFGGLAGTILEHSETQIGVNAPTGVTNGPISVKSPQGVFVSSNFYVAPVLTGFSPTTGRANTNVALTGNNFLGATNVTINGVAVIMGPATTNTSLQITLPVGVSSGAVRVFTPAGSAISTSNFVVLPTLFGFSPGAAPVGASVTLTGANFNVGTPTVRFNGIASTNVTGISFGQLTASVPAGASSGPISITTSAGSHTNSAIFFLPAAITSFTPTNSAPGTTITITGKNLLGTTNVNFNGTPASFTTPVTNTSFSTVVPANVTTGPITVTTPAGTASSSNLFYATPIITGFSPTHGLPGTNVNITGLNFLGATAVKFNGVAASFVNPTSNTNIQATVPANAQTGVITVFGPAGSGSSTNSFVLDASDVAVSLAATPDPVLVGSNLTYTLTITNLGPLAAPAVQLFDNLPASATLKNTSASQGTLSTNGNQIIASLGSIAVGSFATVTIVVAPISPGTVTNFAGVSSGNPDPATPNNVAGISTTVLPLPILSVGLLSGNRVRISWPVALTNYSLEFKTNLSAGTLWSSVSTAPTISGSERVVVQTNTISPSFFRLKN